MGFREAATARPPGDEGGLSPCQKALIAAAQSGDPEAKRHLVEAHMGLVGSVVQRFAYRIHPGTGGGIEADDLFQVGCIGLLKAVQGFDLRRPVRFSTYAVPVIVGEVRRHLRQQQPLRVSRSLRDLALRVRACRDRLSQEWGRAPTVEEVARALGISREEVAAADGAVQSPDSLDRLAAEGDGEGGSPFHQLVGTEESGISSVVENHALKQALDAMEPWERELVTLRYFQRRSQVEVASTLGVSQAHVSRVERRILARLRNLLA